MRDEGSRITEIADRAELTKQTVVYLVNDLERLGYLERIPDPRDGRAKLVRPTDRGHAAVTEARPVAAEIERDWTKLLGPAAMTERCQRLEQLHDVLWPQPEDEHRRAG